MGGKVSLRMEQSAWAQVKPIRAVACSAERIVLGQPNALPILMLLCKRCGVSSLPGQETEK